MRAHFVRGGLETRKDILDRVLNRLITIQLEAHNIALNDKGKLVKGIEEDTDHFIDTVKKSGIKWKMLSTDFPVSFEFTGTKEQLIPIIGLWTGDSNEKLAEVLKDWQGDETELADLVF
jgi:hypothetical protein